jgi:serine-type D-Ala-D-Ala carboxypeptidase (penicillin-binding protein 5/6)
MTDLGVLQEGRVRRASVAARARRARRTRRVGFALLAIVVGLVALLAFMASGASGPATSPARAHGGAIARAQVAAASSYGLTPAPVQVHVRLKAAVRSGLLFDVRTGRVLWNREPERVVPIASLTKMMTALLVAEHSRPSERVIITRAAIDYSGSGVGVLPFHKKVPLEPLLYGLLLPSGNDAAIALAQHVAGNQARFIGMMNAKARALGLSCTHFTTVSGIVDQGNHSCATDLAIMAHALLQNRRLARIVATRDAVVRFPVKGGHLWLYNNNPLLRLGYPGADGVKTGFTTLAGRCLVATAKRGHKWLGVVLLHSDDPPDQAMRLLDAGFATRGA